MTVHPVRRFAAVLAAVRDACRANGGVELAPLLAALAAGLAALLAAGAVAASRPAALVGAVVLAGLAAIAVVACLLARRGRVRLGVLALAGALVVAGGVLGILFRWPLAAPYAIVLAFGLLRPHLTPVERHRAILLAVPLAALLLFAASPDPNWPAASMAGPLGQLVGGLVVGLLLLVLDRARTAVEAERARYRSLVEGAPVGIVRVDPTGRIVHANPAAARLFGVETSVELEGRSIVDHFVDPGAARRLQARLLAAGTVSGEIELRRIDGTTFWARHSTRRLDGGALAEDGVGFEGTFEDVTAERAGRETAARLAAIVESAADAIVGLDPAGRIASWNPAAAALFGRPSEAALGRRLGELVAFDGRRGDDASDSAEAAEVVEIAVRRALAGQPARGIEREIDGPGGRRTISITVSPIESGDQIVGASLVACDVTELRRLERALGRVVAERSAVLDALRRIEVSPTLEATADAVARELSTTDGFASAAILVFDADGRPTVLSSWLAGERIEVAPVPPIDRLAQIRQGTTTDPWTEALGHGRSERTDGQRAALVERGIRRSIYAPLGLHGETVGLLVLGLLDDDRAAALERLPAAAEFAALASALLNPALLERRQADAARTRIRAVIGEQAFTTVFQPIVDLASGAVLGYEALTRFADGAPPDRVFAEAARSGLGGELELATLEVALEAARPLPANAFIDLNVGPELILAGEPLRSILRRAGWGVVLEITEHTPIGDYAAFRAAVAALGPDVRLAVDDAGAGYASLRHILELRPAFVKLDRWLVAGIDADPPRQALLAGMVHAAERTGYTLVAEGVEREAERRTLLELGVRLGQGYLFGAPSPAATWARQAPAERLGPILASLRVSMADAVGSASAGSAAAPGGACSRRPVAGRSPGRRAEGQFGIGAGRPRR